MEDGRGIDRNEKQAAQEYRRAAGQSYPNGMAALARCYEHGVGLERNPYLAADLYDRAARRGHVGAAYALGNMLLSGDAIGQDPARALGAVPAGRHRPDTWALCGRWAGAIRRGRAAKRTRPRPLTASGAAPRAETVRRRCRWGTATKRAAAAR